MRGWRVGPVSKCVIIGSNCSWIIEIIASGLIEDAVADHRLTRYKGNIRWYCALSEHNSAADAHRTHSRILGQN